MSNPLPPDMLALGMTPEDSYQPEFVAITEEEVEQAQTEQRDPYPAAILKITDKQRDALKTYITEQLDYLIEANQSRIEKIALQELAYRALSEEPKTTPFVGACNDVVPVIAMAVDPVHARLDTGIFKVGQVFHIKTLRRSWLDYSKALEKYLEYYQKHKVQFRRVAAPRLLELTKHGTAVFKTIFEHERYKVQTYNDQWEVIESEVTRFRGPQTVGVPLQDFLFPPGYENVEDCPMVAERIFMSWGALQIAQASGKITNIDVLKGQEYTEKDLVREVQEHTSEHVDHDRLPDKFELYEIWFRYDLNGDGLPETLVATWHHPTQELLQLRYNWYFHQQYPYTVIPYSITNGSLDGIGIAEMSLVFQNASTKWHQMATDNAYLANIRMFIARKGSSIEDPPVLYSGRTFFVEDPSRDFVPFQAANIYNSTLQERQNVLGLAEKRTGVSDYLVGRESPIVGSRATATSTLALIQEGTRRVEEVLENIRQGFSDIAMKWIHLWMQYGTDDLEDIIFDTETSDNLKRFFTEANRLNIYGALSIDLSATDAANNKSVQQQLQLAIIQVMMNYLTQVMELGQLAITSQQQGMQSMSDLATDVADAAKNMFKELLETYDVPNPEEYLITLENYLNDPTQSNAGAGIGGGEGDPALAAGGVPQFAGMADLLNSLNGSAGPRPVGPPTPGVPSGPPPRPGMFEGA